MKNSYQKKYQNTHKNLIRAKRKIYYKKNKDRIKEKQRLYREAHPDYIQEYREKNRLKVNIRRSETYFKQKNVSDKDFINAPHCFVCNINKYLTPEKTLKNYYGTPVCQKHLDILLLLKHNIEYARSLVICIENKLKNIDNPPHSMS